MWGPLRMVEKHHISAKPFDNYTRGLNCRYPSVKERKSHKGY